jgi:hypothetical protein
MVFLLQPASRWVQLQVISIICLSLAFCADSLFSIARRRLRKALFKCPDKAGSVLVSDAERNFFNTHVAVRQKMRCFLHPLFAQPFAHADASLELEQALEMPRAKIALQGQIADFEGSTGLNHLQNFSHAPVEHCGRNLPSRCCRAMWHAGLEHSHVCSVRSCETPGCHRGDLLL